jgi:hypothetical protein
MFILLQREKNSIYSESSLQHLRFCLNELSVEFGIG